MIVIQYRYRRDEIEGGGWKFRMCIDVYHREYVCSGRWNMRYNFKLYIWYITTCSEIWLHGWLCVYDYLCYMILPPHPITTTDLSKPKYTWKRDIRWRMTNAFLKLSMIDGDDLRSKLRQTATSTFFYHFIRPWRSIKISSSLYNDPLTWRDCQFVVINPIGSAVSLYLELGRCIIKIVNL